jgi:hypothetical protein
MLEYAQAESNVQSLDSMSSRGNYKFVNACDSAHWKFKLKDGELTVLAIMNNKRFKFKLGTGISRTVISIKAAKKLKLEAYGESEVRDATGAVATRFVKIDSVQIADLIWYPGQLDVIDDKETSSGYFGKYDGVLGFDFFELFPTRVDFDKKQLIFFDRVTAQPIKSGDAIPINLDNHQAIANMAFDGLPIKVLIDLAGTSGFDLFFDWPWINQYTNRYVPRGRMFYWLSTKSWLKFGEFQILQTSITIKERSEEDKSMCPAKGVLGVFDLKKFNLFIDYPNSQIFFKEREKVNK